MEARAWRLCAGAAAGLLGVLALVGWRATTLDGGWLLALRTTALVAVVGLLGVVLVAGRTALRPPVRREVVVQLSPDGAPSTQVQEADGASRLPAALLLAVLSAAPVLVVLALAAPSSGEAATAAGSAIPAPATPPPTSATPSATPSATSATPTAEPGPGLEPGAATGSPSGPAPPEAAPPGLASPGAASPGAPPSGSLPAPDEVAAARSPATCQVTVAPGDDLWSLAAAQLRPSATARQVLERTRAVHAAHREQIGPDPDLIHPGLVLDLCP